MKRLIIFILWYLATFACFATLVWGVAMIASGVMGD